ncbi:Uncharacterised protein [uncultured archaeon]|nr:Uncharacterised protein [uncultured archaeon]
MNRKKLVFVLGFLSFFLVAFILGTLVNISAAPYYPSYNNYGGSSSFIRQGSQQLIDFFVNWSEPFLQALLGGNDYTGMLLFEKFLIYLLILSMVYLSLKKIDIFNEQKKILGVVAIIVPLLAVRYLNFIWLNTILMQYQILGIALVGLLPFIIYLFFLHNVSNNSAVRKIGWIFFIVIYLGLWLTTEAESYGSVYFWTMLIAFVFLLLDGTIHRAFDKQKWKDADREGTVRALAQIGKQLEDLDNAPGIPDHIRKRERKRLEKRRKYLQGQIS